MKNVLFLTTVLALASGCNSTSSPADPPDDDGRGIGKTDLLGSCAESDCNGPALVGNCHCDELCHHFEDCCSDKVQICGGPTCEELGGECLSQPGDPGFPALCESDLGREALDADCGAVNLACCGDPIGSPGPCEELGGECLSQPGDPGFPALCESDLGREALDADCGAVNLACCGDPIGSPGPCEELGGECLSQPGDPGFPALCESDLGREALDADCGAVNLACCGDPI